jgi:tetratricopeptide (TPR) repeat protein
MTSGSAVAEAKIAVEAGRYAEAVRLLRAHLAEHPDDAQAWHRLSGALSGADENAEALAAADEALAREPDNAPAQRMRAIALLFLKRPAEAEAAAARSIALDPTVADSHALLGEARLVQGDRAGAVAAGRAALAIDPSNRGGTHLARVAAGFRAGWLAFAGEAAFAPAAILFTVAITLTDGREAAVTAGFAAALLALLLVARIIGKRRSRIAPPLNPGRRAIAVLVTAGCLVVAGTLAWIGTPWRTIALTVLATLALDLVVGFIIYLNRSSRRN